MAPSSTPARVVDPPPFWMSAASVVTTPAPRPLPRGRPPRQPISRNHSRLRGSLGAGSSGTPGAPGDDARAGPSSARAALSPPGSWRRPPASSRTTPRPLRAGWPARGRAGPSPVCAAGRARPGPLSDLASSLLLLESSARAAAGVASWCSSCSAEESVASDSEATTVARALWWLLQRDQDGGACGTGLSPQRHAAPRGDHQHHDKAVSDGENPVWRGCNKRLTCCQDSTYYTKLC